MNQVLKMQLPAGFADAVSRRHRGNQDLTVEQRNEGCAEMKALWKAYKKTRDKLDYCEGDWWDKMEIETRHFMKPRFYYAHRKRKKLMEELKGLHRRMFTLLTHTDGNYGQSFDPFWCISAEDCYEDFMSKYKVN